MAENMELAEESVSTEVAGTVVDIIDIKGHESESVEEMDEAVQDSEDMEETEAESKVEEEMAQDDSEEEKAAVDMELLQILTAQNDVLDCMLTQQKKIHDSVRERKWVDLETSINNMKAYSDAFVNLDQCRESYVGDNKTMYLEPGIQDVYVSVRTKLSRSKIENTALATYVSSTKEFVDGVIENCVPQSRAKVYGRNGRIMSPTAESVVLDALV